MNQKNVHNKTIADIPSAMPDEESEEYEGPQYKTGNISGEEAYLKSRAETKGLEPAKILDEWGAFASGLFVERSPIEYVFNGLIEKGDVGMVYGAGGSGKSYLMLQTAIYAAAGRAFACFEPPMPIKTLFLCAEDRREKMLERAEFIIKSDKALAGDIELIKTNFNANSLVGLNTAFLQIDRDRGYSRTEFFKRLLSELKTIKDLDALTIDPAASFWGVPGNEDASGQEFISALREISKEVGAAIIVIHHVSKKATEDSVRDGGGRGSSAVNNGARFAFFVEKIIKADGSASSSKERSERNKEYCRLAKYSGTTSGAFVKMSNTKGNYTPHRPGYDYFLVGEGGALKHLDGLHNSEGVEFTDEMERDFLALLKNFLGKLSRSDITSNRPISAHVRAEMNRIHKLSSSDLGRLAGSLVAKGKLSEDEEKNNLPGKKKKVLTLAGENFD